MQNYWQHIGKLRKILLAIALVLGTYGILILGLRWLGLDRVQTAIAHLGVWAPIAFVLVCTLSIVIAPISTTSFFVMGGLVFGQFKGFLLSFLALSLGCCINFWISRKLGRRAAGHLIGHHSLDQLDRFTARLKGHHSILVMMVVLPLSQDLVSYAVGLTRIRFWQFLVAMIASSLVVASTYVYFGTGVVELLTAK